MRQYESIWLAIKEVETGVEVPVRVHSSARKRLIQAVKLEKTKEVAGKRQVGMPCAGRMKISWAACEKDAAFVIIKFSLMWDTSKL